MRLKFFATIIYYFCKMTIFYNIVLLIRISLFFNKKFLKKRLPENKKKNGKNKSKFVFAITPEMKPISLGRLISLCPPYFIAVYFFILQVRLKLLSFC